MAAVFILMLATPAFSQETCRQADVVVYGGTPAGIAAAIQAARLKRKVILLEPSRHVGGMMSNGLNKTDAAPPRGVFGKTAYGGLAIEFLRKVVARYNPDNPKGIYFESKWAEATFRNMLSRAGVTVVYDQRIRTVVRTARTIKRITMTSGSSFCGQSFIDAGYEGDLMQLSGVTTILGRESRSKYGESAAGAQPLRKPSPHDTSLDVDPYVVPGDPKSGLLPGIEPAVTRPVGSADKNLMAFNYRVCITQVPGNRVPFTKPAHYDPLEFETTARFLAAMQKAGLGVSASYFVGSGDTVLGKADLNSTPYFSTNVWNIGYRYVTANEAGRNKIRQYIRDHIQGLLWFGQTDPRVPAHVRAQTALYGLCADEFKDNGNFPRQVYVRQSRRLVGEFVLTQKDIENKTHFPDTIALGFYPMDQHGMLRTVKDGYIAEEFRKSISTGVYEIPYRVMLPKRQQLVNLLVPVALSSSHAAYTSIRVEPTYMVLGQAAGAAAGLAKNGNVAAINPAEIQRVLRSAGAELQP